MVHESINKLTLRFCLFLLMQLFVFNNIAFANNSSYVTLSGQIARKRQLEVVANNVANANTVGFEQDNLVFRAVDVKQNSRRANSFAWTETTYRSGDPGALKVTNRPTDLAIVSKGYFKLATPRGFRYTLDGAFMVNNQGVLVNAAGFPLMTPNNTAIEIPIDYREIQIGSTGSVFVDGDEIAQVGVFDFDTKDPIIKEGGNLYSIQGNDIPLEEFTLVSGSLRESNVNSALAMAQMVEMQRSYGIVTDMMSNIADLEKSAVSKLTK